jgi:hypothetical protein
VSESLHKKFDWLREPSQHCRNLILQLSDIRKKSSSNAAMTQDQHKLNFDQTCLITAALHRILVRVRAAVSSTIDVGNLRGLRRITRRY